MVIFKHDDDAYRAWLIANPDGFVLNTERIPVARYLKLHRAGCAHIKTWADRNPTSTSYIKVCSLELRALEEWARSATEGGTLDLCPTCHPSGASVPNPRVPELKAVARHVDVLPAGQEIVARFAHAVEELDGHFAGDPQRLADPNVDAELRRWLDAAGPRLAWAGQEVTADEWFFISD